MAAKGDRTGKGLTNPQLDTILKVLAPLGKTLAEVPLDKISKQNNAEAQL